MDKNSKNYVYSHTGNSSLRGGTEKIEALLVKKRNYEKITRGQIKDADGVVWLIGIGLVEILTILLRYRSKINVLKTATYSQKRLLLERLIYYILHPFVKVTVISKWQAAYYYKSEILNLYDLYTEGSVASDMCSNSTRTYRFAYVGRIDDDKGYFEAKIILMQLSKKYKCLMDILLWRQSDVRHLPPRNLSNLKIIAGGRDKVKPSFSEINALVLPYKSLSSTIAIPLVLLEGCLAKCTIYTTRAIKELMHEELPYFKEHIKLIGDLEDEC